MSDLNQTKCAEARELLSAFLDMELELAEVELVEAHLEKCPSCVDELAAIERVVASVKSLPVLSSRDFADDIETRIEAQAIIDAKAKVQQASMMAASDMPASDMPVTAVSLANNVVPMVRPARPRQKIIVMAAAAAVALFGLVAQMTLHPQGPVEVAQTPAQISDKHQPDIIDVQATSRDFGRHAEHKLDMDGGVTSTPPGSDDIVALYDEESGNNGADVGISTNEDGLYAIKL